MDIRFRTAKLAKLCNSQKAMNRKWGVPNAKKLQQRLYDLQACTNLAEMPTLSAGHFHPLVGDRAGEFAVSLQGTWRLVFVPEHDPVPRKADGGTDLTRITAITIMEVEDYHG